MNTTNHSLILPITPVVSEHGVSPQEVIFFLLFALSDLPWEEGKRLIQG